MKMTASVCLERPHIMQCGKKRDAEVFDNKLNTMLCQLKMTVPLVEKYRGKKERRQKLIDIIEKPIWQGIDDRARRQIPDT